MQQLQFTRACRRIGSPANLYLTRQIQRKHPYLKEFHSVERTVPTVQGKGEQDGVNIATEAGAQRMQGIVCPLEPVSSEFASPLLYMRRSLATSSLPLQHSRP